MDKPLVTIGRAEFVQFPELGLEIVPARIDTGAKTASVWASNVILKDDELQFVLFDESSALYTGEVVITKEFQVRKVRSSNGISQPRYFVKLLVVIGGRRVRGYFSLANRVKQEYPVLIGRNILAGKFLVDVKRTTPAMHKDTSVQEPNKPTEERV